MIIVLKAGATQEQVDHVVERIESLGLEAHLSRGTFRTIIGVIGVDCLLHREHKRMEELR